MKSTNYAYLNETARRLIDAPDQERIQHILSERFINYGRITKLINDITFLMNRPPRTRASGIIVQGEPAQGKTMFAHALHRRFPPQPASESHAPTRPVVMISMSGAHEARAIHTRILKALDAVAPISMRLSDREELTLQLLYEARAQLLVLDEIQDVLRRTMRQRQNTLDAIKYMMNTLTLPVLALGTAPALVAFREDPHMAARFSSVELPLWKAGRELAALLKAFESSMPLRKPSHLSDPLVMRQLITLAKGTLGGIASAVMHAAVFAVLDGSERISIEHLERTAHELPPAETTCQVNQAAVN